MKHPGGGGLEVCLILDTDTESYVTSQSVCVCVCVNVFGVSIVSDSRVEPDFSSG